MKNTQYHIFNDGFAVWFTGSLQKFESLSDKEIACGVFNTACRVIALTDKPLIRIELSFDDAITLLDVPETYIRFRIPHNSLNKHCNLSNSNYKTIFESPIITDKLRYTIKMNELRSLPPILASYINEYQKINKVIFSLFAGQKYEIDDSNCYKIRHLEEDLYKNYVPKNFNSPDAIAYQWLSDNKKHYNFFIKIEIKKLSYISILLYISLVILLSFLGNILWNLFTQIPFLSWLQ